MDFLGTEQLMVSLSVHANKMMFSLRRLNIKSESRCKRQDFNEINCAMAHNTVPLAIQMESVGNGNTQLKKMAVYIIVNGFLFRD